jgi:hypothetical protein
MLSRVLARSDERFLSTALSTTQRRAYLARLKASRVWVAWGAAFIGLAFMVIILLSRGAQPPATLVLCFLLTLMIQGQITSQIHILELLERGHLQAPGEATPGV